MTFSPFYNLYGQPQVYNPIPYGEMFRPKRPMYQDAVAPTTGPQIPEPPPPPQPSFGDALSQMYNQQSGPAMSAYSDYLKQAPPNPEQFKPSKMRRLGAILSGFATGVEEGPSRGFQQASGIVSAPYQQALQQYGMAGGRLKEAADVENAIGQRQLQTVKLVQDIMTKERDDQRADMLAESLLESRKMNILEAQSRIERAGETWRVDEGTGILYHIRRDGTATPVGKYNLSTNERVQSDREDEQFRSALTESRQRRMAALGLANQKELKQTPSITNMDKPGLISPAAQRTAKQDATDEVLNDPKYSWLRDKGYIEVSTSGYRINKRPKQGNAIMGATAEEVANTEAIIAAFEAEVERRASERMNKRTTVPGQRRYVPE